MARAAPRIGPAVVAWQRRHGRHDLPWQRTRDPYRIWVSEIMLQQTQVAAVIPYFERFVATLPDVASLARADADLVLRLWSGLGYYGRARNLHRAAREIVARHDGRFPASVEALASLPGIGRSTAAAIAVFAFGARAAILDGNVKRVLARVFAVEGFPGASAVEHELWRLAERALPRHEVEAYTQGLMDLGATVCTRASPRCAACPLQRDCAAHAAGRVAELPHRRAARRLEERGVAMLIVEQAAQVVLERRPPSGVWGGLWSLPEVPAPAGDEPPAASIAAAILARLGVRVARLEPLPPLVHTFTHFRLRIEPWCVEPASAPRLAEPGVRWWSYEDALQAALPQPIRRLLRARLDARLVVTAPDVPAGSGAPA